MINLISQDQIKSLTLTKLLEELKTNQHSGISTNEANLRLLQFGSNEILEKKIIGIWFF